MLLSPCHPICLGVNSLELLWIEMKINTLTFLCDVCYGPTSVNAQANINFLTDLQCGVDRALSYPPNALVLLSDFNAHYDPVNPSEAGHFHAPFYRCMECTNLHQVITILVARALCFFWSRGRRNKRIWSHLKIQFFSLAD